MPSFIPQEQQYDEIYENYKQHAVRFGEALGQLTAKKVFIFKSAKIPVTIIERNIGLILMTLFSALVDNTIRLTNDKGQLFDKSWTTGVFPYF